MPLSKAKKKLRDEGIETLRKCGITEGTTVYTILRHVSRSGMLRSIDLVAIIDGELTQITYSVSRILDRKIDQKRGGIKEPGCGMDMGFHLVYNLSFVMFGDGYKLNQRWI